mgnify:CR=1 FL=1|tara:strand:- start:602 stop:805 length:204 start_codon:yes stop_codon:yes gene_type:complete
MAKLSDIIDKVTSSMILSSSRRIIPNFIPNREFYKDYDPKLQDAEKVALDDMRLNGEYIPPELENNG